jgi:hypothetical protein
LSLIWSKKIFMFILCILMAIPVLIYFWYIYTYGVNVIFWDEWGEYPPLYDKLQRGTLSFADMFTQQNEHRPFFPRISFLLLGCFSNFNTVVNMYFSALLLVFTLAIIFYTHIRFFGFNGKALLGFLPVPYLLFSLVQFRSTLMGFQIAWYMLILFSVLSFVFLEKIKSGYIFLAFAIISGVIASYSALQGLLVWPVGILYFIFRGMSEKDSRIFWLKIALSWIVIAILVVSLYLVNYHHPGHHPSTFFIFLQPVDSLRYFLALIGGIVPIDYLPILGAISLGSLLLVLYFYAILSLFKLRGVSVYYLPVLLMFFSLSFDGINTIGRSGFGIMSAFSSRYTTFNLIGIIGIYLSLLTFTWAGQQSKIGRKVNIKNSIALIILLLIIFSQISMAYPPNLVLGKNLKTQRTGGACALLSYENASNSTIEITLYPFVERFKELATICEKYKLNVFSNPPNFAYFPSNLTLSSELTLCSIETLNGISVSQQKPPLVIKAARKKEIVIEGWAVDKEASDVASAVFINIDDEISIPTIYGIDNKGVSEHFKNVRYRYSGYFASFSRSIIEEGEHKLYLKIISNDGTRYFKSPEVKFYLEYITAEEVYGTVSKEGMWYVDTNMNQVPDQVFGYGTEGDVPLVGDINQDGIDDMVYIHQGAWYVTTNTAGGPPFAPDLSFWYGPPGDTPVVGDINQDGTDDIAYFHQGAWYVDIDGGPPFTPDLSFWYGSPGDTPIVGDINQDGNDDIAFFHKGTWHVTTNTTGGPPFTSDISFMYGCPGDTPIVGDINQDGTDDIAYFHKGAWYVTTNTTRGPPFTPDLSFWYGYPGDTPIVGNIG